MIQAYGGSLQNRIRKPQPFDDFVKIDASTLTDLFLIAEGGLSPLTGFMNSEDYESVLNQMTLAGGLPFSIPIVLPISGDEFARFETGQTVGLIFDHVEVGTIKVSSMFPRSLAAEASQVYGTTDTKHPGVKRIYSQATHCLGGEISFFGERTLIDTTAYPATPLETRKLIEEKGWNTVVGFQTRNPIHRAHEYITKSALETVDGLLVHPLVGETKSDDIPADVRLKCYEILLDRYYQKERTLLGILPLAMRYAGPREAIFHAIIRRNYGCSHIIIGRDHAGVGDYYGTYDAQKIFERIDMDKLGIRPMKFEHAFWCNLTETMATAKTSPSTEARDRIFLSGTKVREMLGHGERPPREFTRPEVADVLVNWATGQTA